MSKDNRDNDESNASFLECRYSSLRGGIEQSYELYTKTEFDIFFKLYDLELELL